MTSEVFRSVFEPYGIVLRAWLMVSLTCVLVPKALEVGFDGEAKGYGFVEFEEKQRAEEARLKVSR